LLVTVQSLSSRFILYTRVYLILIRHSCTYDYNYCHRAYDMFAWVHNTLREHKIRLYFHWYHAALNKCIAKRPEGVVHRIIYIQGAADGGFIFRTNRQARRSGPRKMQGCQCLHNIGTSTRTNLLCAKFIILRFWYPWIQKKISYLLIKFPMCYLHRKINEK